MPVYNETNHCQFLGTKAGNLPACGNIKIASARRTMFFNMVCVSLNRRKSPKQPQSSTGLNIKMKMEIAVNITVKNSVRYEENLRRIPMTKYIPNTNSTIIIMMPVMSGRLSHCGKLISKKLRYSSILYPNPRGSMAFTNPENTKNNPKTIRAAVYRVLEIFVFIGQTKKRS